jgi:hypothetical protein
MIKLKKNSHWTSWCSHFSNQFLIPGGKGLGYTIGRGLDAVLHFTCYSYSFSCYFDQRKINESRPAWWVKKRSAINGNEWGSVIWCHVSARKGLPISDNPLA